MGSGGKPIGRDAVMAALVRATSELVVERGPSISVRDIAARAGVNHGLVHTYFGNKEALLTAALDDINRRAAAQADEHGFPPVDLARRRNGELAKALVRVLLDATGDPFSSHPVVTAWRDAIVGNEPGTTVDEAAERVAVAAVLALGAAVFMDYIVHALGMDDERGKATRARLDAIVRELGGLPDSGQEYSVT